MRAIQTRRPGARRVAPPLPLPGRAPLGPKARRVTRDRRGPLQRGAARSPVRLYLPSRRLATADESRREEEKFPSFLVADLQNTSSSGD